MATLILTMFVVVLVSLLSPFSPWEIRPDKQAMLRKLCEKDATGSVFTEERWLRETELYFGREAETLCYLCWIDSFMRSYAHLDTKRASLRAPVSERTLSVAMCHLDFHDVIRLHLGKWPCVAVFDSKSYACAITETWMDGEGADTKRRLLVAKGTVSLGQRSIRCDFSVVSGTTSVFPVSAHDQGVYIYMQEFRIIPSAENV